MPLASRSERAEKSGVSRSQQKKLDRLYRERIDLLERIRAGTLSVNAAYIEAVWTKRVSLAFGLDDRRVDERTNLGPHVLG